LLLGTCGLGICGLSGPAAAQVVPDFGGCITYSKPDGESYFAISVKPKRERVDDLPRDVVILFDTSASQTGTVREKSLAAVEFLLLALAPNDRVQLAAADLKAVPMHDGFAAPQSPEMRAGLEKLKARTPLGATDMEAILSWSLEKFPRPQPGEKARPRAVLYLGDAMSRANLLRGPVFQRLINKLVAARVSVSGYVLGSIWDTELIGSVANNTGGSFAVDRAETSAKEYASFLAQTAHGTVLWPVAVQYPERVVEAFPQPPPPLRTDRDTIYFGRGKLDQDFSFSVLYELDGKQARMTWQIDPSPSDDTNGFLVELANLAKKFNGQTLPVVGQAGLAEARRTLNAELQDLLKLATQTLNSGDLPSAEQITRRALKIDPNSPLGNSLLHSVKRKYLETARKALNERNFLVGIEFARKVLEIEPANTDAQLVLSAAEALRTQAGAGPGRLTAPNPQSDPPKK